MVILKICNSPNSSCDHQEFDILILCKTRIQFLIKIQQIAKVVIYF